MKNKIGIMQGRLSPAIDNKIQAFPHDKWQNEFLQAKKIGFNLIEWIVDSEINPLFNEAGIDRIRQLSEQNNIKVNSVCADIFMEKLLFNNTTDNIKYNLEILKKLIEQSRKCGIKIIDLPFVDSSSLQNEKHQQQVLKNLELIKPILENANVVLGLETDLEPQKFLEFLKKIDSEYIKANYDVGNSVANNFDPILELDILNEWIVNIHVKDRYKFGNTISLGKGDVNFKEFFQKLKQVNYRGDLIIQGAREDLNEFVPVEQTCSQYLEFVNRYIEK